MTVTTTGDLVGDELIGTVLDRATADASLPEAAKLLVLAALEGQSHLANTLAGAPSPENPTQATPAAEESGPPTAARAYLSRVTVTGFRGIGPSSTLTLDPGPGLTVIAGRNGCGKSSFAEALEVALTRHSYRWTRRTAVWSESWRNLHQPEPASIVIELAEESRGRTTVGAEWASGAGLDGVRTWAQRPGEKRAELESLGWHRDLELFRPFLSYDELGALFAEPSKLHDALSGILGLDRLEDAVKLLVASAKALAEPATQAAALAKQLLPALGACPDARGQQALTLLRARKTDIDAIAALATGGAAPDSDLAVLRSLSALQAPELSGWQLARDEVAAAVARRTEAAAAVGDAQLDSAALLRAAIQHFEEHGEGPCPVCGEGILDPAWAARARDTVDRAGLFFEAVHQAETALTAARTALGQAVPTAPPAVTSSALPGMPALAGALASLSIAWAELRSASIDDGRPAGDVEALHAAVAQTVSNVVALAGAEVADREDAWQPLAVQLAEWVGLARKGAESAETVSELKAAEKWLKANTGELRNDRLVPLAERARAIWSLLRQESNVDLGALSLEGTNTRRRVELTASVDGQDAGAFGVMSQGELHALALALFLPRATAQESPFGFLVIDDPVQAMDPAKVDGLAQVLHQTAQDRQVVVLTHDDRLPEAVRRLQLPARILEVTRDAGSSVVVHESANPAERYLQDARAVAKDDASPPDVVASVVPELCRLALESTCRDSWFRARLLAGAGRSEVEEQWAAAQQTRKRLALVVHGNPDQSLDAWLSTQQRKRALGVCTSAVHQGLHGNPLNAIEDVRAVIRELESAHAH